MIHDATPYLAYLTVVGFNRRNVTYILQRATICCIFFTTCTAYHTVERFAAVDLQSLRMSCRGKRMARIAKVLGAAAAMVWLALLPGCAVYKTFEKCGFAGCPD